MFRFYLCNINLNIKLYSIVDHFNKMEELRNLVICEECNYFLDIPIRLPCLAAICNKHISELKEKNDSNFDDKKERN